MSERLDLNLLRVFDALLQEGSVTAASDRLHLSIPATSRALGRLRRAMDDPILVRAGRGMAPTPFALRTAPRVRSLLDEASALISGDREVPIAELERTFTIRINDGVAATLAAAVVDATSAAAPGVILRFVGEGSESVEALRDGSVDLDIGVGDVAAPDIRAAVLYRERLVGIVRADSPLGRNRRPTLAQLCRHPHVSASRRGRTRGPLDDALDAAGLRRTWPPSCPPSRSPRCSSRRAATSDSSRNASPSSTARPSASAGSRSPRTCPNSTYGSSGTPASTPTRPSAGCARPSAPP